MQDILLFELRLIPNSKSVVSSKLLGVIFIECNIHFADLANCIVRYLKNKICCGRSESDGIKSKYENC